MVNSLSPLVIIVQEAKKKPNKSEFPEISQDYLLQAGWWGRGGLNQTAWGDQEIASVHEIL